MACYILHGVTLVVCNVSAMSFPGSVGVWCMDCDPLLLDIYSTHISIPIFQLAHICTAEAISPLCLHLSFVLMSCLSQHLSSWYSQFSWAFPGGLSASVLWEENIVRPRSGRRLHCRQNQYTYGRDYLVVFSFPLQMKAWIRWIKLGYVLSC